MDTIGSTNQQRIEARLTIEKALASLSVEDRAFVILMELQGWSIAEISKFHGKSESAVKSRLARARHKMRKVLSGDLLTKNNENLNNEAFYAVQRSEP